MDPQTKTLARIAEALERLAPPAPAFVLSDAARFQWRPRARKLAAVQAWTGPDLALLRGVDDQAQRLQAAVDAFADGARANNALLWGARGTGKSALVKAVFAEVLKTHPDLKLIDVPAAAAADVPDILEALADAGARAILFLDDLSLEAGETALRALKPALDGGLAADAGGVMVIATANRRHILAAPPDRAEQGFDPARADAEHERLALSDRFGLWLGFHSVDQPLYLEIVRAYAARFELALKGEALQLAALRWSAARGARSGRTAWQFVLTQAAEEGRPILF